MENSEIKEGFSEENSSSNSSWAPRIAAVLHEDLGTTLETTTSIFNKILDTLESMSIDEMTRVIPGALKELIALFETGIYSSPELLKSDAYTMLVESFLKTANSILSFSLGIIEDNKTEKIPMPPMMGEDYDELAGEMDNIYDFLKIY